jgi:hypothetical protein
VTRSSLCCLTLNGAAIGVTHLKTGFHKMAVMLDIGCPYIRTVPMVGHDVAQQLHLICSSTRPQPLYLKKGKKLTSLQCRDHVATALSTVPPSPSYFCSTGLLRARAWQLVFLPLHRASHPSWASPAHGPATPFSVGPAVTFSTGAVSSAPLASSTL